MDTLSLIDTGHAIEVRTVADRASYTINIHNLVFTNVDGVVEIVDFNDVGGYCKIAAINN